MCRSWEGANAERAHRKSIRSSDLSRQTDRGAGQSRGDHTERASHNVSLPPVPERPRPPDRRQTPRLASPQFLGLRRAHEPLHTLAGCSNSRKVRPCLAEAEFVVRSAAHDVCIVVVLTIVLPETDLADSVACSFVEGEEPAAGAWIRAIPSRNDVCSSDSPRLEVLFRFLVNSSQFGATSLVDLLPARQECVVEDRLQSLEFHPRRCS